MKIFISILFFTLFVLTARSQPSFVRLVTSKGDITLMLYDQTPKHRDVFLNTIKKGFYNNTLFNRVIRSFVSQAGELDETIMEREKLHPEIPLERIPAEMNEALFHKKGALGAGRNDNPEKSDYFTQIYLVAGKIQTDAQLDIIEKKKGRKIPPAQREIYKTIGGTPDLDQDYTVFGEITDGMAVAEAINSVPVNGELPVIPVTFHAEILSKKEAVKLWKKISKAS